MANHNNGFLLQNAYGGFKLMIISNSSSYNKLRFSLPSTGENIETVKKNVLASRIGPCMTWSLGTKCWDAKLHNGESSWTDLHPCMVDFIQ